MKVKFKRIRIKEEVRTTPHMKHEYTYWLEYVGRYFDGKLTGISKHENKFMETMVQGSLELRKPISINRINPNKPLFQKAKEILDNVEYLEKV